MRFDQKSSVFAWLSAQWYYFWAVRKTGTQPASGTSESEIDPPIGSNPISPRPADALASRDLSTRPTRERCVSVEPPVKLEPNRYQRIPDVGFWLEESLNSPRTSLSDLESERDSDIECVDADSDGDMDVESVIDM